MTIIIMTIITTSSTAKQLPEEVPRHGPEGGFRVVGLREMKTTPFGLMQNNNDRKRRGRSERWGEEREGKASVEEGRRSRGRDGKVADETFAREPLSFESSAMMLP